MSRPWLFMTPAEITLLYGERCPDFEPECSVCKRWARYDQLVKLETEDVRERWGWDGTWGVKVIDGELKLDPDA